MVFGGAAPSMLARDDDRRIYFKAGGLVIINDDFLSTDLAPEGSVDLIVTSPPYNVDVRHGSFRDDMPYERYLEFTERWLGKALRLAKPGGRMCLNIPIDKSRGRRGEGFLSVYADVVSIAKRVGWKYFTTIIWNEQSVSRRTAWGSWMSASAPYVIALVEAIVVMYRGAWKRKWAGRSDVTREEFVGSGTTLVACALLNRRGIGVEVEEKYCTIAKRG